MKLIAKLGIRGRGVKARISSKERGTRQRAKGKGHGERLQFLSLYTHLKEMITIALDTGMRQGEILAMKKGWINLREGLIIVPRHSQKRKKKGKRLLRKNPGSDYLLINPESGTRYTTIQNSWNGILKKAGLEGKPGVDKLRFHDLRHTAATELARAGKDMKFIAQYLGPREVRTSARYIHYRDEDLKDGRKLLASPVNFHSTKKKTPANPRRP